LKTIETHGTFEDTIADSSSDIKELARALRALIIEIYPQVVEVPWPKQCITGYGLGPKKMSEHFCYIGVFSKHVNLGFYYGVSLQDPDGLLVGSGKKLRHVKVQTLEQVEDQSLRDLVEWAIKERETALGVG
jgi:hypothetical protein